MRKIYVAFLSLLLIVFIDTRLSAQAVGSYVFTPSAGTFTPLSGATVSTAPTNTNADDGTEGGIPIGFNFTYGGSVYTHAAVTTNGFLRLGNSAAITINTGTANYDNTNFGASTNVPLIAAFWDDNNATGGTISYLTSGSAPNRVFTIEWNNVHLGGGGSTSTPTGTFQIQLSETTNAVAIVYGTINTLTSSTASIGLNDATSYLAVTPGAPATATSAATNNTISSAANIPSGTTYLFFPPPPCVPGSLAGGTAQTNINPVCPGGNFILSVTGASFGTGLTYLWQSSPTGAAPWTDIATATGANFTTNQTTATYYRRKMTCSGTDAFSDPVLVNMNPPVSTFPWTENFDGLTTIGATSFPTCWVKQNGDWRTADASWTTYHNPRSGANYLVDAWSATNEFIWTNGFQLTAGTSYDFSFWWSGDGFNGWTGDVFYNTAQSGTGATQMGASFITSAVTSPTTYSQVKRTFTPAVSGVYYFAIRVNATSNPWYLGFDDFTFDLTPPCVPPTGLTTTLLNPTNATVAWTASVSNPTSGYEWEVRSSGAAGSGATGLDASGATAAGVTSAVASPLTPNTAYSLYVRANCGGVYSPWTLAYVFTTPCTAIPTPFTETFSTYSTTFPPTCWTRNNSSYLLGVAPSAGGAGTGSALFAFYDASAGTALDLVSPIFNTVPAGYRVTFDHAYATFAGEVDSLQILYSTDGGNTYTRLTSFLGGTSGPLNTGGAILPSFSPSASQWDEKAVGLPAGTNRIMFRGYSAFGNNLFLDNIRVEQTPSCLPVIGKVTALGISPTEAAVTFNSPGNSFIVEYGAPGFTPGTTNTAGTGGTVVFGTGSPIIVSGLTPNTTYDFYVRQICVPGVDFSSNKKATATTLCDATNIPYVQNFESSVMPAMPTCTSIEDVNGNSGSFWFGTGGGGWETYSDNNPLSWVSPNKSLLYYYDFNNLNRPADDWFYTQGLNLVAGTTYRLKFFYKAIDGANYPEKIEVKYGTRAYAADMTAGTLFSNTNVTSVYANPFDSVRVDFTPTTTGVYYIGFHAMSNADEFGMLVDDISVRPAPVVDMGVTGVTLPNLNCPTNGVFVTAKIKNYNLTPINFATYPVTVTATITGAGSGTLSTVINSGTLDPSAVREVYLSPAFNFSSGGVYNMSVATSSPFEGEIANDSFRTSINVNPAATVPVITPASAQFCIGGQTQLSTQFTGAPPAPVTLPAVASGTVNIAIPDGSASGVTNSLNITSVPAGATITGISVTVNLTHTWISDIAVNLKAPNGKILNLFNQQGGSGDNLVNTVISSTSTTPLSSVAAPFTGTFAADGATGVGPTGSVSDVSTFAGLYSVGNGTWTLALRDYVGFDAGTLNSWSITLTYQMLPPAITWTPVAGLFTNAAATTPYTAGTNSPSIYVKPAAAGNYVYTATATGPGGCTATATASVTVSPLPTIAIASIPDTVCISDPNIALAASPVGGSWSGVGVSGTNFIPPSTAVGTYTLTYSYTSPQGCTNTATKRIAVKDCPERIIRLSDNALSLYPNPNTGLFYIKVNSVLYNYLTMKVYTSQGLLVRTQQLNGLAWGRVVPIDLTNLPGGVYMVKFYYDGGVRTSEKTFKVIIGLP